MKKKSNFEIIKSRKVLLDAIAAGTQMEMVWIQDSIRGEFEKSIRSTCKENEIPLKVVPRKRLDIAVGQDHHGIAGFISLIQYYKIEDVLPMIYEKGETPFIVCLDGITDVRNFGSIARSAEIFGVHTILIPNSGSAQINSVAISSSAGALIHLPVCRTNSITSALKYLKQSGCTIFGAMAEAEKEIHSIDLNQPFAIVLGSEGKGISNAVKKTIDESFRIPQKGNTESLNVAVAAGIFCYQTYLSRTISS